MQSVKQPHLLQSSQQVIEDASILINRHSVNPSDKWTNWTASK